MSPSLDRLVLSVTAGAISDSTPSGMARAVLAEFFSRGKELDRSGARSSTALLAWQCKPRALEVARLEGCLTVAVQIGPPPHDLDAAALRLLAELRFRVTLGTDF